MLFLLNLVVIEPSVNVLLIAKYFNSIFIQATIKNTE